VALRLLHTSDWHLGHTLHGLDRTREHGAFLDWLLGTLEAERVDALLVAGDVFDASNPPAIAVAQWYRFLADAWRRLPRLQIVVVGGNHDSAARLDAPHPLLDALGRLHVVGGLPRRAGALDAERLVVPLTDAAGRTAAFAAAVPFLRPADLPLDPQAHGRGTPAEAAAEGDALLAGTGAIYGEALAAARARATGGEALVALGHLYVAGGQVSELSERKILGGHLHALPSDLFPDDLAYVALGHLHLAQRVGGREEVRYAGSPIALSFDERHYPHQVVLFALEGARAAEIRALPVPCVQELRRVPGDAARPLEDVLAARAAQPAGAELPEEAWPWLEVRVALSAPEPALRSILDEAVDGKAARLLRIAPPRLDGTGAALAESAPRQALTDLEPGDVFEKKWARDHAAAPPPEVVAAFQELLGALLADDQAA